MAMILWEHLQLDRFWAGKLPPSREGTRWLNVLKILTCYRLIQPGSEWRLHREWYGKSSMGDLLGEDGEVVPYQNLLRCLDRLLTHKTELFPFLKQRWKDLFNAGFEVLLYDQTSTYFECDPPETGKRKYGYSRDKRFDCVQVVIALVVTPEGFPLAYEVMDGNTSDRTTLRQFLRKIEDQYGQARRVWIMDRGIPTEEVLAEMRASETPIHYFGGHPQRAADQIRGEATVFALGEGARQPVCQNHYTPWRAFCDAYFARHTTVVWKASRGFGGKSYLLAALGLVEAVTLGADVNILGGSGAQSHNVHKYMNRFWLYSNARHSLLKAEPGGWETKLVTGNHISALKASQGSVRGPHPQRLRMDEVDEMNMLIFDAATGQPMATATVPMQTV